MRLPRPSHPGNGKIAHSTDGISADTGVTARPPLVDIRDVSLTYGHGEDGIVAVEHLTLEVEKGAFVAVVGPSGCGKSSLMKLVTGLVPPTSGDIFVDGERVRK